MISLNFESQHQGLIVAGVDEVGRGPLAGPVVAGAVIIDPAIKIDGINDSKKLSPKKREELNKLIMENYHYSIGQANVLEIEELNITGATILAINRAIMTLSPSPEIILVDGNMKFNDARYISIIKGDSLSLSIAAASIVAKVYRDNLMKELSIKYPEYGFEKNSGYGTASHIAAIKKFGPIIEHRKKFLQNIHF